MGTTTHYRPLRQQKRIDDNDETHLLDATIIHDKMSIKMTTEDNGNTMIDRREK